MSLTIEANLRGIIEPSLNAMGYEIVQLKMTDAAKTKVLQLMAERRDGKRMEVSDCEAISHRVSALLDVEDVVSFSYNLEVMSPGIDRPLVKPKDFENYIGFEAKIETILPINERKRFKGVIQSANAQNVEMLCDGEEFTLPQNGIRSAKLVLTDALIKETMKRQAS